MEIEGEVRDEFRSSTAPNTRRRLATKKTSLEENNGDETTVAVTTQESLDGIREKAMRIARTDELESQQRRKMVQSRGSDERQDQESQ